MATEIQQVDSVQRLSRRDEFTLILVTIMDKRMTASSSLTGTTAASLERMFADAVSVQAKIDSKYPVAP